MKKPYERPLVAVEQYSLTQTVSSCVNIKINSTNAQCVIMDPDSTNMMRNLAHRGGFLGTSCVIDMSGFKYDGVCYHTNINAAFTS